jgi:truncated hemoglobin YjbI
VINLRRILGRDDYSPSRMGVTVEFHGDLYTILVDGIGEVCLLEKADFEAAPATLDSKLKQLCTGIYRLDGELLAVLDVNQILSAETIAQTPPIKFVARRPKEAKDIVKRRQQALPAPANDEPDEPEADAEEVAEAKPGNAKAKPAKNIFRKSKPASSAKPAEKAPAAKDEKPAAKAVKPAAAAPAPKAAPAAAPSSEAQAAPEEETAPAAPASIATDVAPGEPTPPTRSEDLMELVGGDAGLGKIVTSFYEEVQGDAALAPHYEGADMAAQAQAMQSFFSSALKSNGKDVKAPGHHWLSPDKGLDDELFNKCLAHFEKALHTHRIPDGTIFRVLAVFERHRESIVD